MKPSENLYCECGQGFIVTCDYDPILIVLPGTTPPKRIFFCPICGTNLDRDTLVELVELE